MRLPSGKNAAGQLVSYSFQVKSCSEQLFVFLYNSVPCKHDDMEAWV